MKQDSRDSFTSLPWFRGTLESRNAVFVNIKYIMLVCAEVLVILDIFFFWLIRW